MSINLYLAFEYQHRTGQPVIAYDRLRLFWQDYEAFDRIKAEAIPLPEGVYWYDDDGEAERKVDPYGNALTWMPAHRLAHHLFGAQAEGGIDYAVVCFVEALPPETRVVLWWC
jgi:hypothetical protein